MLRTMKTTDVYDKFGDSVDVADCNSFKDYGKKRSFSGIIATVKCFEDNPLVKKSLEQSGAGKVLVVDGGGSMRCALLGDMIAEIAFRNNWSGIIINGCIRDSIELGQIEIGVKALGTNPRKSGKSGTGETEVPVTFAGVTFIPGEFVVCDEDGIVISKTAVQL